jgi:alpha-D-ribose 1-methylphosphonate 5-triphosphate synthase subunit PhnL
MSTILQIEDISKSFTLHNLNRHIKACQNISLTLQAGTFTGITGRSGSGKSTILKLIWRSYVPQSGRILYNSQRFGTVDISQADERTILSIRRYEMGYVSQFLNVIPRITARNLVEQAWVEHGGDPQKAAPEAQKMLAHFDLDRELWDSYPGTFSGGEKLRLNIAMTMVRQPRLLLLDEPTASLDQHSKQKVRVVLEGLKSSGTTILGIFHDLEFMQGLCDTEFSMEKGLLDVASTS